MHYCNYKRSVEKSTRFRLFDKPQESEECSNLLFIKISLPHLEIVYQLKLDQVCMVLLTWALNLEGISGFRVCAVIIIGRFPAAQFYTHSFFIFGSYFPLRARISGIVWTPYDWPIEVIMPDCLVVVLSPDQDGKPGIVFLARGQF